MYLSTNNDFIKSIKKLNEKKYRDSTNTFLVEGEHLVLEAIKNNLVKYVIVRSDFDFDYDNKIIVTDKVLKYIDTSTNKEYYPNDSVKIELSTYFKAIMK